MTSIFNKSIIAIITEYSAEEYVIDIKETEIVAIIQLCQTCGKFDDFKTCCKSCKIKQQIRMQSQGTRRHDFNSGMAMYRIRRKWGY